MSGEEDWLGESSQPKSEEARLAASIQHTLGSTAVTRAMLDGHLNECLRFGFDAAVVPPFGVPHALERADGTSLKIASWVGFPLGTDSTNSKKLAAADLVENGVDEIDLMPNVGFMLDRRIEAYKHEVEEVVGAAGRVPVKVMLELPILPKNLWALAVEICVSVGVACVKNASSGSVGIATPDQIRFLKMNVPSHIRVKASGGIRSIGHAISLLDAGADLLGTSAGHEIMAQFQARKGTEGSYSPGHLGDRSSDY